MGATGDAASFSKASMTHWLSRGETAATAHALDSVTVERVQWLFERVCRHGYGAEHSLRVAVQIGAMRMGQAGASRSSVRAAFIDCIRHDVTATSFGTAFLAAEARVDSIRSRMAAWADAVVIMSPRG